MVRRRQVIFQQLQRLQRLAVRELGGQYGNVSFQRMGHRIQTTERAQGLRHFHDQVGINNRHIRGQGIVSQRVLLPGGVIGNNGERRHFRAGTRRGGDRHHFGFNPHFRELVDTFTDIHKAQRQLFEVGFRMFVHDPHDFRRVHRGAAAQGDNHVRFESVRQLSAFTDDGQSRVSFHFKENFCFNASRFQYGSDLIRVAVVKQEAVGDDQRAFVTIGDHFVQSDWQ